MTYAGQDSIARNASIEGQ